jgi:undecaprenyl diphosphate synthase
MTQSYSNEATPRHVAIIMDGNGRWAERQGKARIFGHKAGVESVREVVACCQDRGIESLTLFAFSSENWRRPAEEVGLLMELFLLALGQEIKRLHRNKVRLRIVGDCSRFNPKLQQAIRDAEALTAHNTGLILNVAANYGGRWDISQACQQLAQQVAAGELTPEQITEEAIQSRLCLSDQAEPDLFIRTGGEIRISNFLLWNLAYCELYFTETLWPDFGRVAFEQSLASFSQRQRRFGKTGAQVAEGKPGA